MSKLDLIVEPCDFKAAKYAVTHWHYSKSMPTPPVIKFGVWELGTFVGCVLFSRGANKNLGKKHGLDVTQVCELTRVALNEHMSNVSQIVSMALRSLKKSQSIRLVYSYADPHEGHHGGIYQAMNWIYTGETPSGIKDKLAHLVGSSSMERCEKSLLLASAKKFFSQASTAICTRWTEQCADKLNH